MIHLKMRGDIDQRLAAQLLARLHGYPPGYIFCAGATPRSALLVCLHLTISRHRVDNEQDKLSKTPRWQFDKLSKACLPFLLKNLHQRYAQFSERLGD